MMLQKRGLRVERATKIHPIANWHFVLRPDGLYQDHWACVQCDFGVEVSLSVVDQEGRIGSEGSAHRSSSFLGFAWDALKTSVYYAALVLVVPLGSAVTLVAAFFATFSVVDPPVSAMMVWRQLEGETIEQTWVPLDKISPHLVRAVISSEDARFCRHGGIDWRELDLAMAQSRRRGGDLAGIRGASTISMQVTKNLLLWPGRDFARKGLEFAITPLMETIWSKRRVLEVYLNIAEWGPGIFGAEAAARAHFGKSAARLSAHEASLLAAALPNPIEREAGRPGRVTRRYAQRIRRRMPAANAYAGCILGN